MALPFLAALGSIASNAPRAIQIGSQAAKQSQKLSMEILGYDFVGLIQKLVIFYSVCYAIAKFMEAAIFFKGGFIAVATLFGIKLPKTEQMPQIWVSLFQDGYSINDNLKIKFWDIVNIIAIIIIIWEWNNVIQSNEKSGGKVSIATHAIFGIMALGLSIFTLPNIYDHLRKMSFNAEAFR